MPFGLGLGASAKPPRGAAIAALATILCVGCTQARFEAQNSGTARSTADTAAQRDAQVAAFRGQVEVLSQHPAPPFERLGVVIVSGSGLTAEEKLMSRLKQEAALRGANAIVLQSSKPLERATAGGHVQIRWAGFAIRRPPKS